MSTSFFVALDGSSNKENKDKPRDSSQAYLLGLMLLVMSQI